MVEEYGPGRTNEGRQVSVKWLDSMSGNEKGDMNQLLEKTKNFLISAQGIAYSAAIFMGLFFVKLASQSHRNYYYLFVLLPFLAAVVRHLPRDLFRTPTFKLAMLFFVYFALTLFWSTGRDAGAIFDVVRMEFLTVSFVLLVAWLDQRECQAYLLTGMAFGVVLSSFIAPYLFYVVEGHSLVDRLAGLGKGGHPIKSPTIYGVALITLGAFAYRVHVNKIIVLIVAVSSMAVILLAQSRGVVLSLLVVYIAALILTKQLKQLFAVAVIFIGVISYACLGGAIGHYSSMEFVRADIWLQGLAQARESLAIGYGIYPEQKITVPVTGILYEHPHNVFLSHLLYGGVPGLLVLVVLVGSLVRSAWKAWVRDGNLMLLLLVIYFIACATFDYSTLIHSPDVEWLLFWWVAGLVVAYEARLNLKAEFE